MGLRDWLRAPRYTLPLFLAVTLGSAVALIWLGWRVLDSDQALGEQQVRQRLEYAADLIASGLARELEGIGDRLPAWLVTPDPALAGHGALVVALTANGVDVEAGAPLLYAPATNADGALSESTWMPAERYKFRDRDSVKAATALRTLANSSDPQIRAGALVRLARNLRKANQPLEALDAYTALADLGAVTVGGEPAALVARQARCRLLDDLGRVAESRAEGARVLTDLDRGRWRIERATFFFHQAQAERCAEAPNTRAEWREARRDALARATAVSSLWEEWRGTGHLQRSWQGRRSLWIDDRATLVVWHTSPDRLFAFVAGTGYLTAAWQRLWADQRTSLELIDGDGHRVLGGAASASGPEALRMGADTRLPWTLRIASDAPDRELAGIARRRRLLLASVGVMAFLVLAGSYFVARAVHLELAVARLQSDFVSAVSHEFRTPLTSLRHLTELLKNGQVASDDRRQQYTDVLAHETERLHRFVETLLNLGRIDAGAEQYRFEREEPTDLVRRIVEEFRAEHAGAGRRIDVNPNGRLPPAWIDREAFTRALWNLLDNAAKYSAADAPIDIELRLEGDRIAISVRDCGVGIPAAEHQRIFHKFVRGAGTRASGVKGTGVGLAIVRHVMQAHGGDARVTSAVGRGSTFTLSIPTAERHT